MYITPKKQKFEKKELQGKVVASKISGLVSNKVVFYVWANGKRHRFIALFKDNEEAKGYFKNYPTGVWVKITYLDTFFPLIVAIKRI